MEPPLKPRLNQVVSVCAVILFSSCQLFAQSAYAAHEKVAALVQQMTVVPASGAPDAVYTVSFDLSNTGDRAEVGLIYVADDHSKIARTAKELKGLAKVVLQPGESRRVSVTLDARALAYFAATQWYIAPGSFGILIGRSSEEIGLTGSIAVPEAIAKTKM